MKIFFDFVVSLIALILLIPSFLTIGIIIKLDDYGPVFFRQKRVGKNGKLFTIYKFRTMRVNHADSGNDFEPGNTSRISRAGKLLRKYKIDELPQFVNVLKGEMSIVGPRPEVKEWVQFYPERWNSILKIKPGITDNASLIYCNEEKLLAESRNSKQEYLNNILPRKLDLYEDYLQNHSIIKDIKIIFSTLRILYWKEYKLKQDKS